MNARRIPLDFFGTTFGLVGLAGNLAHYERLRPRAHCDRRHRPHCLSDGLVARHSPAPTLPPTTGRNRCPRQP